MFRLLRTVFIVLILLLGSGNATVRGQEAQYHVRPPNERAPGIPHVPRLADLPILSPFPTANVPQPPNRFHSIIESKPNARVIPSGGRKSFFQKIDANVLWAPSAGRNGVGITEVGFGVTAAVPLPSPKTPLLIAPSATLTFLSPGDSNRFDCPESLYSTRLGLTWMVPTGSKTLLTVGATPSWSSDFRQDSGKALRVPVHFGLLWLCNPRTRLMIGAAYLDRDDYPWIPFAGITWTPSADWCFEIGVPRTRISRRVFFDRFPGWPRLKPSMLPGSAGLPESFDPTGGDSAGYWVYLGGDFGGGTWAVKRADGVNDLFLYNDLKILLGLEFKRPLAFNWGVEAGYMFGRELKYDDGHEKLDPEGMVFLRFRASY